MSLFIFIKQQFLVKIHNDIHYLNILPTWFELRVDGTTIIPISRGATQSNWFGINSIAISYCFPCCKTKQKNSYNNVSISDDKKERS